MKFFTWILFLCFSVVLSWCSSNTRPPKDGVPNDAPEKEVVVDKADAPEADWEEEVIADENEKEIIEGACNTPGELAQSSNSEIEAMRTSIVDFRASLSDELLEKASTCLDDERLYLRHNTPANARGARDGIQYADLSDDQLTSFKNLLQLFLSSDWYKKVNDITVLSEWRLKEIKADAWDPGFYYIDMFGNPETSGSRWFQLDGHHAAVTFVVHGDTVTMAPAFLGWEPSKNTYNGESFDIFAQERDLALSLYDSLSESEIELAVTDSSTRGLQVGPADRAGEPDPYIGEYDYSWYANWLKYSDMSETAKENLKTVMKEYVYNLQGSFADIRWENIEGNIDETYFAWVDDVETPTAESKFYYRVYNPYVWIEFNTEDVTWANSNNIEAWNHVHSITRIPENEMTSDYSIFAQIINNSGPKMLSDHYAVADHHSHH